MRNPFDAESRYAALREQLRIKMDDWIELAKENNTTVCCGIYGLAGTGKTRFLQSYFSPEKCAQLAQKGQLYPMVIAAETPDPDRMLGEMERAIVAYAERYVEKEKLPTFLGTEERLYPLPGDRLRETVRRLREKKLYVSVIIDEFHRISQSESVTTNHYDTFRNLHADADLQMNYIVATDSDFDPKNPSHAPTFTTSFFVHIFDFNFTTAIGMSRTEFSAYIDGFIEEGAEAVFTEAEMDTLYTLSGGIPEIARRSAHTLFLLKHGEGTPDDLERWVMKQERRQMDRWSQTLTLQQKALLVKAAKEGIAGFYEDDEGDAGDILVKRGFFISRDAEMYGASGTKQFACKLYHLYAEKYLQEAYSEVYSAEGQSLLGEEQAWALQMVRGIREEAEKKLRELGTSDRRIFLTRRSLERVYEKLCKNEERLGAEILDRREIRTIVAESDKLRLKI